MKKLNLKEKGRNFSKIPSIINCPDPQKADVVLIGANYDRTSSFGKGADKGPAAIMNALENQIEVFERFTKTESAKKIKIAYYDLGELNSLLPQEMVERVSKAFGDYYKKGKFIIVLGGEHSVSNGPFRAIAAKEKPSRITILQIDAHADLRNDDSDYNKKPWGKYAHSAVMRRAYELGFNIVQVGIRAYSQEEYNFFTKNKNIRVFEWGRGQIPQISSIIKAIKTDKVYLTLDADGFDPSYMPATGTPVQGGLEWNYAIKLINEVFKNKKVIAADIVEVSPRPYDNLTEYGAAQICYNFIAHKYVV